MWSHMEALFVELGAGSLGKVQGGAVAGVQPEEERLGAGARSPHAVVRLQIAAVPMQVVRSFQPAHSAVRILNTHEDFSQL